MKITKAGSLLAVCLGLVAATTFAHHSTNGIYDEEHEMELTGTVKSWRFINPHPYLVIEAEDETGTVREWDVSYGGAAVVHLKRQGYAEDTFKTGDVIVVKGPRARAPGAYGILIEGDHPTWPDGSAVVGGGSMF